jgi:outer membrane protein TolC
MSTIEGRKFMVTRLVSEIANSYYELMALDNQLDVVKRNIEIQQNALQVVRLQKQAARVTELAVKRFEAEVLKNQSRQFTIQQQIIETENRINFLVGRYPQPVARDSSHFNQLLPQTVHSGIPSQLLENRPDIKQAQLELEAAKLDVKVARARFYPSLEIDAGVGYQAYSAANLVSTPASFLYNAVADVLGPLINRKGIKAAYFASNSAQMQAVLGYERAILKAYTEAANQLAMIENLEKSFELRSKQVDTLNQSIDISSNLFKSARADYWEVLMTRREALESQMELIETKKMQMTAMVNLYQALGGGWK